mmetsp:Transcript_19020/g.35510  ORF Transcript_19020/g.35510 Transcript_19020/m.35510 type:complete len:569 (-) Transcript_19020:105-1811(-)
MSVNRLLCILWFCALEENILATHDELSQLQIKLEMKASPRDKDSISLAEQVRSVELKRGDVASFNFTQPIERNIASSTGSVAWERNAQNVLFIVADDLRSLISGVHMHTPHLNAFAKESLVLTNSHVQQALCSPSRASILFGRRPDTMHVWDASQTAQLRNYCKTCKTIPELFKDAGYYTVGMGKVFDDGGGGEVLPAEVQQDPQSWSDPAFAGDNWFYGTTNESHDFSWESVNESANGPLQDSQVRDHAVSWLRALTARNTTQPWFLAVGFRKPHLPFTCPDEFYNLYSVNDIQLASNPFAPPDMPPIAWTYQEILKWNDVKATAYTGAINETLNECKAKELVRGYQACISYHDYNVGTLLNELKALGHWEDTIILFWSDHGYKLGEHGGWAKSMNFHLDTSAPIILRVPGLTDGGVVSDALVEHVDVMATLLGAAGLNPPPICSQNQSWMIRYCTEGRSFLDLASNPWATWKNASFSQFDRDDRQYMGYSMNTNTKLRFTAWVDFDNVAFTTNFSMTGEGCGFELYNHSTDPHENDNLAYRSGYGILVQELFQQLKLGWRATNTLI